MTFFIHSLDNLLNIHVETVNILNFVTVRISLEQTFPLDIDGVICGNFLVGL
jgi:hypothetical protein